MVDAKQRGTTGVTERECVTIHVFLVVNALQKVANPPTISTVLRLFSQDLRGPTSYNIRRYVRL